VTYACERSPGCEDRIVDRPAGSETTTDEVRSDTRCIGVLAKQEEKSTEKKRPYDLVAHLIGCVDSGGANLSQNTGEKFAKLLRESARARGSR
jgi:hypothetical protein